jgi:hypothetical protein
MDPGSLVEGGEAGLLKIEQAFRDDGADVRGIYLIRLRSEDGAAEWSVRLITSNDVRSMIHRHVKLRRSGKLPRFFVPVRYDYLKPDNAEASRIIEYANAVGEPTVVIEDAAWRGMYFEYVLVASYPPKDTVAA